MLKWLRDKMISGSEEEFNKCIDMSYTFIKYAQEEERLSPSSIEVGHRFGFPDLSTKYYPMIDQLLGLSKKGYSPKTMSELLDLDMECRRLWAIAYGGSDLKYNKTFEPK